MANELSKQVSVKTLIFIVTATEIPVVYVAFPYETYTLEKVFKNDFLRSTTNFLE